MSKTLWRILTYGNEFFIFVISFFLSEGKEKCVAVVGILIVFSNQGKAKYFEYY